MHLFQPITGVAALLARPSVLCVYGLIYKHQWYGVFAQSVAHGKIPVQKLDFIRYGALSWTVSRIVKSEWPDKFKKIALRRSYDFIVVNLFSCVYFYSEAKQIITKRLKVENLDLYKTVPP